MKVQYLQNLFNVTSSPITIGEHLSKGISFKSPLTCDVFEKSPQILSIEELFKMRSFDITKETFDKLSEKDFKSLISAPIGNIAIVKQVNKYSDLLKQGFDKISDNKPYTVIPIGRSLASISEFMRFKGTDTALCPLSGLTHMNAFEIDDFVENSDIYLKYLKNFGIDLKNLSKDRIYYFIDYKNSGNSILNFQEILSQLGVNGRNINVMSCGDVFYESKLDKQNASFLSKFKYYLHSQNLKSEFCPIPKLPYSKIDDAEKICNNYFNNKGQETMIIALARLYDSIKNPQKYNFTL